MDSQWPVIVDMVKSFRGEEEAIEDTNAFEKKFSKFVMALRRAIAQTIVDIGKKCILYGVRTVFISEVITKSTNYMEKTRFYLNRLLKEHCEGRR